MNLRVALCIALLAMAGCKSERDDSDRLPTSREFPRAYRPISVTSTNQFATEAQRDRVNEAKVVMDLAHIGAGTTVADIGAGEGYYTVRLGERVGKQGRVLAQDIDGGAGTAGQQG